jgi:hypothetical protein
MRCPPPGAAVLAAGAWELGGAAEPDWSLEAGGLEEEWRTAGRRRRRSAGQWRTPWEVGARVVGGTQAWSRTRVGCEPVTLCCCLLGCLTG